MKGLDQASARYLILLTAGGYILFVGVIELAKYGGLMDPLTVGETVQAVTTLASLVVGTVLGFYLASGQRPS